MLIVGGTFDKNGGKPSYFMALMQRFFNCDVINGGNLKTIYEFRPKDIDVLIWMPNIDNKEDKILKRLKVMNPKMLLISSKRLIEKHYSNFELVNRAIKAKANLSIIIRKGATKTYLFDIIDPLGNVYYQNKRINNMLYALQKRINELKDTQRIGSKQTEFDFAPDEKVIDPKFVDAVRAFGTRFTNIIQANNPDRFLGNASTRCEWGFPTQRINKYGHAFVSKRNINKENIIESNFVKTYMASNKVFYNGPQKPSVDTPVQLMLYAHLPNINYMIHGHCYVKNAPFTKNKVPCGDMREVREIMNVIENNTNSAFYAINLLGHGCIIMSADVDTMYAVELTKRPFLEP